MKILSIAVVLGLASVLAGCAAQYHPYTVDTGYIPYTVTKYHNVIVYRFYNHPPGRFDFQRNDPVPGEKWNNLYWHGGAWSDQRQV